MLYRNYSRKEGEWIPNVFGGKENLEAITFLKRFNEVVYGAFPDVQTIAEESTDWPMVSRPVYVGGLGFGMKWNMGWMHDTLDYFSKDPVFRKYHHNQLTFSIWYAFSENFVLSISHDEVVHGKGALAGKMPGDEWQRYANLRLLLGYMYGHPGKKLLFMGCELAQWREWNHEESLEWHILDYPLHRGVQSLVRDLNTLLRGEPALHEVDFSLDGFSWVDFRDWANSVIVFMRKDRTGGRKVLVACNLTPVVRYGYRVGVPVAGYWKEALNSDSEAYGGSNVGNGGGLHTEGIPSHGQEQSLSLTLPPLGVVFLTAP
jgi:1,4-alpha-glucan branching enzyme